MIFFTLFAIPTNVPPPSHKSSISRKSLQDLSVSKSVFVSGTSSIIFPVLKSLFLVKHTTLLEEIEYLFLAPASGKINPNLFVLSTLNFIVLSRRQSNCVIHCLAPSSS